MKIKQLSDRLRSLKKYLDEESYNIVVENLNLPSTDFLTKSGGISTSKKLWSSVSELEQKALEAKELPTVNELKKEARISLEESGVMETLSGRKQINEAIRTEINVKFKVDKNVEESIQEWYDFINDFGAMLSAEYPDIEKLENWIYSSGIKSYTELYGWMQDAERVINEALRG